MLGRGNVLGLEDLGRTYTTQVNCISGNGLLIRIDINDFINFVRDAKKVTEASNAVQAINKQKVGSIQSKLILAD